MCEPSQRRNDSLGSSLRDDLSAGCSAVRNRRVHDPVRIGNHVEIVLDDHNRVAGVDEPVQYANQFLDVGPCADPTVRLVKHIEGAR